MDGQDSQGATMNEILLLIQVKNTATGSPILKSNVSFAIMSIVTTADLCASIPNAKTSGILSRLFPKSSCHIQDPSDERIVKFGQSVYMAMCADDMYLYLRRLADEWMPETVAVWLVRNFNMPADKINAREIVDSFLNLVKNNGQYALARIGTKLLNCLFEFKSKGAKTSIDEKDPVYQKWFRRGNKNLKRDLYLLLTRTKGAKMLVCYTMEMLEKATPVD